MSNKNKRRERIAVFNAKRGLYVGAGYVPQLPALEKHKDHTNDERRNREDKARSLKASPRCS